MSVNTNSKPSTETPNTNTTDNADVAGSTLSNEEFDRRMAEISKMKSLPTKVENPNIGSSVLKGAAEGVGFAAIVAAAYFAVRFFAGDSAGT